jgi:hypothetical protein
MDSDHVEEITNAVGKIANAITDQGAGRGRDEFGAVGCLTEATMGISGGLKAIADALEHVAGAIEGHGTVMEEGTEKVAYSIRDHGVTSDAIREVADAIGHAATDEA